MSTKQISKALLAGAAGGVVGLAAMRLYWQGAKVLTHEDPRSLTSEGPPHTLDDIAVTEDHRKKGESSTQAVGRILYEAMKGETPSEELQERLGLAVHRAYGLSTATLFQLVRSLARRRGLEDGLVFGTALWLLGDELMVPLLGLAKGPTAFQIEQHLHRLGVHLVFGVTVASVARALLRMIDGPQRVPWHRRLLA
jgi:hypothetical protein